MKKIVILMTMGALALSAFDSAAVYKKCAMCHGKKGEKVALKTSPKLNTLSEEQITAGITALLDGSSKVSSRYLGMHQAKLKGVKTDDASMLAQYILTLK